MVLSVVAGPGKEMSIKIITGKFVISEVLSNCKNSSKHGFRRNKQNSHSFGSWCKETFFRGVGAC